MTMGGMLAASATRDVPRARGPNTADRLTRIGQNTGTILYRRHPAFDVGEPMSYARVCRVENVIRLYLEALL